MDTTSSAMVENSIQEAHTRDTTLTNATYTHTSLVWSGFVIEHTDEKPPQYTEIQLAETESSSNNYGFEVEQDIGDNEPVQR